MSIGRAIASRRQALSLRATTLYAVLTSVSFSASSSAPTPLYHLYQQGMGLSNLMVTLIFASYAVTMIAAFLTVARLSDTLGRRPMILAGLALNALALVLFMTSASASQLIAARLIQGVAVSIGMTTLGATILDADRRNGPVLNSITAFIGLSVGALLAGALIQFAPLPTRLVFAVLLAVTAAEAIMLLVMPETSSAKPFDARVLVPAVRVPGEALPTMVRLLPLNLAAWSLGGLYLSLMPTLVSAATGVSLPLIGAVVVSALPLAGVATVLILRQLPPDGLVRLASLGLASGVAVTLLGIRLESAAIMLVGTVIAGVGFGASYAGNLRSLLPLAREHERAGLLAAYFVESYVSFALPAVLAGLSVPEFGLIATSEVYGVVLIGLALLPIALRRRRQVPCPAT